MLGALEVRLSLSCDACDGSLPINGPVPLVKCGRCMEITRIEGDRFGWRKLLLTSFVHAVRVGTAAELLADDRAVRLATRARWPDCSGCGKPHDVRRVKLALMKHAPIACACGVELVLQPVPAHFAAVFPFARHCVDAEVFDETPGPPAPNKSAAVMIACMACAGALPVDGAHRLVACSYCKTSNYLPDDLWLSLHPAVKREAWTILFDEDDVLASVGR